MKEYTVQPGDTLYSIARLFDVTTARLRSLNPELAGTDDVYVGRMLRIPNDGQVRPVIEVNGYIHPVDDPLQWSAIFPYLTYLSIFDHEVRPGGVLAVPDSAALIAAARGAGVAPLMAVTNTVGGAYSGGLLHSILSDPQAQQALIKNIGEAVQANGYYGVNFGFEYIFPEDYGAYASFLDLAANQLHMLGLIIVASIRLVIILQNPPPLAESLALYSRILDRLILMPGGYACSGEQDPIDAVQQGLDFVTQYFSSPKTLLGVPNCCYEWEAPYPDNAYRLLSPDQVEAAVHLAGAVPQTDPNTQRIFFNILEDESISRVIMCESAHSLAVTDLVNIYNLGGVSFRTLNLFNFASYQTINVRNDIRKVLPLQ
ncbi:MAG TPA: LysM peptidoglycan-binding domain-containing protein [Feifaniaceae bacterium]|nr:LysM peptidoglycan-binding domain-containing protein [Feifaniaceae bacterium]